MVRSPTFSIEMAVIRALDFLSDKLLDTKHYLFPLLSFPLILIHLLKIFLNTQLLWLGEHIAGHEIAYLIHEGAYQQMP
jgi:hypothetical protein